MLRVARVYGTEVYGTEEGVKDLAVYVRWGTGCKVRGGTGCTHKGGMAVGLHKSEAEAEGQPSAMREGCGLCVCMFSVQVLISSGLNFTLTKEISMRGRLLYSRRAMQCSMHKAF